MIKAFLDHFAAVIGSATIAVLITSVSHEVGYFFVIGSHFQTFLTTTDYLTNGVLWLRVAFVTVWGMTDWSKLKNPPRAQSGIGANGGPG